MIIVREWTKVKNMCTNHSLLKCPLKLSLCLTYLKLIFYHFVSHLNITCHITVIVSHLSEAHFLSLCLTWTLLGTYHNFVPILFTWRYIINTEHHVNMQKSRVTAPLSIYEKLYFGIRTWDLLLTSSTSGLRKSLPKTSMVKKKLYFPKHKNEIYIKFLNFGFGVGHLSVGEAKQDIHAINLFNQTCPIQEPQEYI